MRLSPIASARRHIAIVAFWLVVGVCVYAVDAAPAVDPHGRLVQVVLSGGYEPNGRHRPEDVQKLPVAVRARLRQFRDRVKRFHSRLRPPPGGFDPDGKDGFLSRQATERALVALFDRPGLGVEEEAAAYARSAVFWWEYEGYPEGPLAEAEYASDYLRLHPETPLAPYLHLFLASRYRSAFEAQANHGDRRGQSVSAGLYRDAIQRARASADPLIRAAAEDLDRQPFFDTKLPPSMHPRSFR